MEDKVREQIIVNLRAVMNSCIDAVTHWVDGSPNGIIGALSGETERITHTIELAKTLREFGGGQ